VAALVAGQLSALIGLLLFGGVLMPIIVAFLGSGAGVFVVADPRGATR
jgi:hypothetical protein